MTVDNAEFVERLACSPKLRSLLGRLERLAEECKKEGDQIRVEETEQALEWLSDINSRRDNWREIVVTVLRGWQGKSERELSSKYFEIVDRVLGLVSQSALSNRQDSGQLELMWSTEPLNAVGRWSPDSPESFSFRDAFIDALHSSGLEHESIEELCNILLTALREGKLTLPGFERDEGDSSLLRRRHRRTLLLESSLSPYEVGSQPPPPIAVSTNRQSTNELEAHAGMALIADLVALRITILKDREEYQSCASHLSGNQRLVAAAFEPKSLVVSILQLKLDYTLCSEDFAFMSTQISQMTDTDKGEVSRAMEEIGVHGHDVR